MKVNKRFADYVKGMNFWKEMTNKPLITFPLSHQNIHEIAGRIENELSPENLCCDGELTRAQTKARYTKLMGVKKDLEAYCTKNHIPYPHFYC